MYVPYCRCRKFRFPSRGRGAGHLRRVFFRSSGLTLGFRETEVLFFARPAPDRQPHAAAGGDPSPRTARASRPRRFLALRPEAPGRCLRGFPRCPPYLGGIQKGSCHAMRDAGTAAAVTNPVPPGIPVELPVQKFPPIERIHPVATGSSDNWCGSAGLCPHATGPPRHRWSLVYEQTTRLSGRHRRNGNPCG